MGAGNEELTHWNQLKVVGQNDDQDILKYDTRFGIILGNGFSFEIGDNGILEVWLKVINDVFQIRVKVPRTTGSKLVDINGKYLTQVNDGWNDGGGQANKLATWRVSRYAELGVSDWKPISANDSIDRTREAMALWPNHLPYWDGTEKTPNFAPSVGNPADHIPMTLDLELHEETIKNLYEASEHEIPDDWKDVDMIMIESEAEEDPDPEPAVPNRAHHGYNTEQKVKEKEPEYAKLHL